MKKITDIEERKELKKEGIFLEGMFWAKYGNSNDVMVIMILVIATALMSFYQFHAEWMDDHTYVLMLLSLLWVGYPLCWAVSPILFYHNEVNKMVKSKELYVNWATIVSEDDKNRCISYIEDDALSPQNERYIVDCIATKKDCYNVMRGERILILRSKSKKGKWTTALVVVNKKMHLFEEKREHDPINITGLVHVPHAHAFDIAEHEKDRAVIVLTNDARRRLTPASVYNSGRGFWHIFCEWNGEKWERKYFFSGVKMMPKADYGDIFYKKLGERRNIRFVRRNDEENI